MTYKKYIKRGDRVYGPYVYHSKRQDGKVISTYHGKKESHRKIFLGIAFLFIILFFGVFLFMRFPIQQGISAISGRAILQTNAMYNEGKPLSGVVSISLKKGELMPSSTKVSLK